MSDPPPPRPASAEPKTSAKATPVAALLSIPLLPIIALGLAALTAPSCTRASKSAHLAEASNNLRNLGLFMFAFEHEWGTFPSEKILRENPDKFPGVRPGDSSNALLSMLIAGGYTTGEEIFFAAGGASTRKKPDNVTKPPSRLLEPGECGFGYVMMKGGRAMSGANYDGPGTAGPSDRPLLVAPLSPGSGGAGPSFNSKPYNGRVVYLRIDGSVKQNRIDPTTGQALLPGDTHLFQTGPGTVWEDEVPEVRMPE